MANSKADKTPKVMDVAHPGKTTPSATARPVIVGNRPMLRRDPMMAKSDAPERPEHRLIAPSVSRFAKTISVLPAEPSPETSAEPEAAAPAPEPGAAPHSITVISHPDIGVDKPTEEIVKVNKKEVAEDVGQEALQSSGFPNPLVPDAKPPTKMVVLEPETKPEPEAKPETPPIATLVPPVEDKPAPVPSAETTPQPPAPEEPDTTDVEEDEASDTTSNGDTQLAPNKAIDEAKRKQEEAKAAQLAEQEKIIASKQYYLPIKNAEARRGVARSLIVLFVVVVLAVVWFDVVLDAGILHVGGLQSVTHFFR